jgi:hypothetical protein
MFLVAASLSALRQAQPAFADPAVAPESQTAAEDDGVALWDAPTRGENIKLQYLPFGGQVFLHIRVKELLAHPQADKLKAALGPASAEAQTWLHSRIPVSAEMIESLLLAWYSPDSEHPPRIGVVARLSASLTDAALTQLLPKAEKEGRGGSFYYRVDDLGYYLPAEEQGHVLVVAPTDDLGDILENPDPPLRKEMAKLLRGADAGRHVTLLCTPEYILDGDGKSLLGGRLERLREPIHWLLGLDSVQTLAVSGHLADDLFLELRCVGRIDTDAASLAKEIRGRWKQSPELSKSFLQSVSLDPYGAAVLKRLPEMVHWLERYTRSSGENQQAILRAYLPAAAAHNMLLATDLALLARPASGGTTGGATATIRTAKQALAQKTSLVFAKDTLEKSLELLASDIGLEIVIQGGDLQLEGITKNQSFELSERDKPALEILKTILKKANPDGKLVYVVRKGSDQELIWITTRAAAKKKNLPLPTD